MAFNIDPSILKYMHVFFHCMSFARMYTSVPQACVACRGQERLSDSLILELQTVVNFYMVAGNSVLFGTSARAIMVLIP